MSHFEGDRRQFLPHAYELPHTLTSTDPEINARTACKSSTPDHQRAVIRKSRITLACRRCNRRKQKCDGARPSCQACERAKEACTYERIARPQYPGGKTLYINALEERIAFLEARLPDHAEDHFNIISEGHQQDQNSTIKTALLTPEALRGSCRESHPGQALEEIDIDEGNSLVDGVAYLSLCASGTTDADHGPYFVGPSSGATIARVIQSSIYRGSGRRSSDQAVNSQEHRVPPNKSPSVDYTSNGIGDTSDSRPTQVQARALFEFFFERIHPRWPLLDRAVYEQIFERQYLSGALSITESSILRLIYAITARFLAVTKKPCGVDDEAQLTAATESMEHVLKQHDLGTVQYLILLGVHGQRSPYGAGAWSQIRYATSICIEMGLHRKRKSFESPMQRRDAEIRRRAFWSCYCLDRVTSIVLGRAFAIADRDINVELPSASRDFWTLTHGNDYDPNKGQWSNVQPFIHIIKLDRIQSHIHKTVFRVDRDVTGIPPPERTKLDKKMTKIRQDLDDWIRTCPQTPKNDNKSTWMYDPESAYLDARDFYGVQYHKAVLFLFTVFLPSLETYDERFITCARSAASVCNAYKRLSQNQTLTYTMISLHSCFVAGLTLIYCIWRDHQLFSYEVVEAAQCCSQILTIFGEKWPGAVKYRDIFDALSQSLFKLTMKQGAVESFTNCPLSLRPTSNSQLNASVQTTSLAERSPASIPFESVNKTRQSMSHLLTDAVKEAFMEVDEEAPGGWQGWRMWNEMMTEGGPSAPHPQSGLDSVGHGDLDLNWIARPDPVTYGTDPVQDAEIQAGNFIMVHPNQWELSGYR